MNHGADRHRHPIHPNSNDRRECANARWFLSTKPNQSNRIYCTYLDVDESTGGGDRRRGGSLAYGVHRSCASVIPDKSRCAVASNAAHTPRPARSRSIEIDRWFVRFRFRFRFRCRLFLQKDVRDARDRSWTVDFTWGDCLDEGWGDFVF